MSDQQQSDPTAARVAIVGEVIRKATSVEREDARRVARYYFTKTLGELAADIIAALDRDQFDAQARTFEQPETFEVELRRLINRHSIENASDTADYILAQFLVNVLEAFALAAHGRDSHRPVGA